jgi:DNA-binding FadR family transcriptional regulator
VSITDDALAKIQRMIVSGEVKPGDRLPREPDLARRLGLSRSSLREAVPALSWVRILHVRQGDGTYVASLDSESCSARSRSWPTSTIAGVEEWVRRPASSGFAAARPARERAPTAP